MKKVPLWKIALSLISVSLSLGYIIWGTKRKQYAVAKNELGVSKLKELMILKLYANIDRCRNRLSQFVLIPSSSGRNGKKTKSVVTQDWDRTRDLIEVPSNEDIHPDCFKPVPDIIRAYKIGDSNQYYECEEIVVETEDGFLLTIHRMPNNGPPVLLQHGLLADSGNWVCGGPDHGLAFILWRNGFDVFMCNSRGNPYSRRHIELNPSKSAFWRWTFDDLAEFDFPASVNKVLSISTYEKLWYIGHSQGTLIAFINLSEDKQSIAAKLNGVICLAPVFGLKHVKGPWRKLCPSIGKLVSSKMISPDSEFLPQSRAGRWIATMVSKSPGSMRSFGYRSARNLLLTWANFDPARYVTHRLEVFLAHTPSGTSFRNVIHFAQNVGSSVISKLDYGSSQNLKKYGTKTPPTYDFMNIRAKLYLFIGTNDWLATQEDTVQFVGKISRNIEKPYMETYWSDNDHLDFIWGKQSYLNLYPKIISIMNPATEL